MPLKPALLSLLLIFTSTQSGMAAIDIYMRIVGATEFADVSASSAFANDGFFPIGSVELGVENTISIDSTTSGGGAGRAIFKELVISKWPGKVSTDIFSKLVSGRHYNEVEIIMVRSGSTFDPKAPPYVMTFGMKLVMAQSLDYSVSDGDEIPREQIVLQFGAIRVRYYETDPRTGATTISSEAVWSRVKNLAAYEV